MRFGIRELIFVVVLLAVPAVSMFYVFKPRNAEIQQAMKEIDEKQAKLDLLATMQQKIEDIDREIVQVATIIEEVNSTLPDREGVEDVLERFHEITYRNRLVTKSFTPDKPLPAAHYMELPIDVVVEGDFDGFYEFLQALEGLQRITQIRDMKLERLEIMNSQDEHAASLKAEFTLSIYYKPDEMPSSA